MSHLYLSGLEFKSDVVQLSFCISHPQDKVDGSLILRHTFF